MGAEADTPPTEEPLAYQAVRGGLWVAISSYWSIGFGFLANIVITRLLAPEVIGLSNMAGFFTQNFRVSPKLGLNYAFVQDHGDPEEALSTYLTSELIAIALGLVLALVAQPILVALGYARGVALFSFLYAIPAAIESCMGIGMTLLEKEMRFGQTSLIMGIASTLSYILAFWLAAQGGGIWALFGQNLAYNALLMLGVGWALRRHMPGLIASRRWRFNPTLALKYLKFGLTIGVGGYAGMLITNLDNFFVGTFVNLTALGFYDRAYRTAQWPQMLLNTLITRAAFYTYARLQSDLERLNKAATMMVWLITNTTLPLALTVCVMAPDLIQVIYLARWLPSAPYLRVLVMISVVRVLNENGGTLLLALGRPRRAALVTFIQLAVLAITGLPLTLAWGAAGTCVAVAISYLVGFGSIYHYVQQSLRLNLRFLLGLPALSAGLLLLGYLALNRLTPLSDLPILLRLGLKGLYVVVVYVGLLFLFQPRVTLERGQYLWRLLARTQAPASVDA
jgi:lipopolysaccharide exporter